MNRLLQTMVVVVALMAPTTLRAESPWSTGFKDLPVRTLTGITCIAGCSDLDANATVSAPPLLAPRGWVLAHRDVAVLELGVLSGGVSGVAGDDAGRSQDAALIAALGGCGFQWTCLSVAWLSDRQAGSNLGVTANVDLLKSAEVFLRVVRPAPAPPVTHSTPPAPRGVALATFHGLNHLADPR